MLTLVTVLMLARAGVTATIDPSFTSMFNTAMNAIMLIYLAKLDKRVTPKVEHIEREVDTRQPGGRRSHDPADDGTACQS